MHLLVVAFADYSLDVISHLHVEFIQGVTHVLDKRGQDILFVSGQFMWHATRYHESEAYVRCWPGRGFGARCLPQASASLAFTLSRSVMPRREWLLPVIGIALWDARLGESVSVDEKSEKS